MADRAVAPHLHEGKPRCVRTSGKPANDPGTSTTNTASPRPTCSSAEPTWSPESGSSSAHRTATSGGVGPRRHLANHAVGEAHGRGRATGRGRGGGGGVGLCVRAGRGGERPWGVGVWGGARGVPGRSDAGLQPFRGRPAIALNSAVRAFACGSAGGRGRGWDEAGVGRGTGHVGCDGGVLSVVVPRPRPRLRTSGEGRVGRADPCCCLRPPRLGGVGAVMEVPWPQGRPARSNSCWSRGRRRWVWRSSAIRSSTCASCSVFAASLRMVASRRAARR